MIEEVAGAVKDLIKVGTVRQFGMSEAAAGSVRLQRPAAHARKVGDHWQPKERRGPSDQQADGDADTAAPTQAARQGLAAGCGWPVRTLPGFSRRLPATAPPRAAGLLVAALPSQHARVPNRPKQHSRLSRAAAEVLHRLPPHRR